MPEIILPFGAMMPDQPTFRNPGLVLARNAIPRTASYGPFRSLTNISNALTNRCLGAISARDINDNVFVYAGDQTRLYELVNATFTDESRGAGYSTIGVNDVWEFAVWNNDNVIIATNYVDAVQSMAIGGGGAGAFANMITSPATNAPRAKHIGIVHRFVVLGWINDADGETPHRVRWSGIDSNVDFAPAASTQSDYEDLATGGVIQRIIGGTEYGLIFQNEMVRTMRYVGAGPVFEMFPLNYAPGTAIPNSVIAHKGMVFYRAEDGFMAINGTTVQPIGSDKIDRYFDEQFDITDRRYLSAAIDPVNKIVAWAFPGTGAASNLPNRILLCKYDELKWAEAQVDTQIILKTETQGYTLDGLDALGTSIDNATIFDESFDSDKWQGRTLRFAAFNQSNVMGHFTGATLAATFETGDAQPVDGRNWQVNRVWPLVDGGDARVAAAARTRLLDSVSYGPAGDMNIDGVCSIRPHGRYMRFRTSLSSSTSWSHIQGLGVEYVLRGLR